MRRTALLLILALATGCRGQAGWAEVFIRKGESYFKKGKYEQSLGEFVKAQHFSPADERIYENMAQVYLKMGNRKAALETLNRIVELNPGCKASVYFLKAELYAEDSIHTLEAIRTGYNPAIERNPDQGLYFYKRGLAYQKLGDTQNADADFESARKLGYTGKPVS